MRIKNEYDAHKALKPSWARIHTYRCRLMRFRRSYVVIDFRGLI